MLHIILLFVIESYIFSKISKEKCLSISRNIYIPRFGEKSGQTKKHSLLFRA